MCPAMKLENPKNSPPRTDGQNRCVNRWQTRYVAHAARGRREQQQHVERHERAERRVSGYATIPRLGMNVTHEMSMPAGENTL